MLDAPGAPCLSSNVKQRPDLMSIPAQSPKATIARAFTVTELLITIACIALLAAIFLPALAKSKARSSRLGCANCMKQIGVAFRSWSIDNNDRLPMQVAVTNGSGPMARLVLAKDGALYGTTTEEGPSGSGTIFRLTTNGLLTTLASGFGLDSLDSSIPPLMQADDGNLYGTGLVGGIYAWSSVIWRLVPPPVIAGADPLERPPDSHLDFILQWQLSSWLQERRQCYKLDRTGIDHHRHRQHGDFLLLPR